MPKTTAYIPGVCNINTEEIASRRKAGRLGVAIFVPILIVLLILNISRYYRVVLFLPAFLAAIGYLQARNKFCVGYAGAGQQNADEGSVTASNITDQSALAQDKARARTMNSQAAVIAVIATAAAIILPHL